MKKKKQIARLGPNALFTIMFFFKTSNRGFCSVLGGHLSSHAITISSREIRLLHCPAAFSAPRQWKRNGRKHLDRFQSRCMSFFDHNSEKEALSETGDNFLVNEKNWRDHSSLTETYDIPTLLVPSEHIHSIIKQRKGEGDLTPYLVSQSKAFEDIHPRIKVVQNLEQIDADVDTDVHQKAILLDPRVWSKSEAQDEREEGCDSIISRSFPGLSKPTVENLASKSARPGPMIPISIDYTKQPVQRILSKLLPPEAQPPPTGFEQIGHVVHLNLKRHHYPYRKLIGSVLLDRLSPKIESVVNKLGEVSGPYRTYEIEVLAGRPETTVTLNEDGVQLEFDLRKVYWCTRLSGERSRLLQEFNEGELIADAFCGVGAFCILSATKLGCTVLANDLNPSAVAYCRENSRKNLKKGSKGSVDVKCGDAFDFIQNLGSLPILPHHIVMNFPLDSPSFLGSLRWWPVPAHMNVVPTIHLYTFARGDDHEREEEDGLPPRDAMEAAVDLVADALLPEGGAIKLSRYRRNVLNKMGCNVKTVEVRDVAPGKVVICVSFMVTNTLLKVMQGDFVDF